nr:putative transposase A [uncultured bacterium]
MIERRIEVAADLPRVWALCEGRRVADHETDFGQTPDHHRPATSRRGTDTASGAASTVRPAPEADIGSRCLADYDTALGLDDGGVA